jgi:hypothetical protein
MAKISEEFQVTPQRIRQYLAEALETQSIYHAAVDSRKGAGASVDRNGAPDDALEERPNDHYVPEEPLRFRSREEPGRYGDDANDRGRDQAERAGRKLTIHQRRK